MKTNKLNHICKNWSGLTGLWHLKISIVIKDRTISTTSRPVTDSEFLHYFLQVCVLVMLDDLSLGRRFDVLCVCVFRTDRPCSGIWTKASICTRWTAVMSSTRSASVPTDTGCVPPQDRASRSGYHQLSKHTVSDWTYVFILAGWCPFGHALTSWGVSLFLLHIS